MVVLTTATVLRRTAGEAEEGSLVFLGFAFSFVVLRLTVGAGAGRWSGILDFLFLRGDSLNAGVAGVGVLPSLARVCAERSSRTAWETWPRFLVPVGAAVGVACKALVLLRTPLPPRDDIAAVVWGNRWP